MSAARSGAVVFRHRGLKLLGVLNQPGLPEGRRAPAVLLLHGFPGAEKNVDVQRRLLSLGVASLCLHFAGAWGSEGLYSFTRLVEQAGTALDFLARQHFVDRRRLGLFGFSMGGWTALNLGARRPALRAVVAVAPVGGPELINRRTPGFISRLSKPLRVVSARALTRDFRAAVTRQNVYEAASRLRCPVLLVHGQADAVVPVEVSRRLFDRAPRPKKLVLAPGAAHDFLDRRDWLARLASGWLAERLS